MPTEPDIVNEKAASVTGPTALLLVSGTSAMVLVLEILAGRLMAPHIGVSLDTFTGIIGTILAGIAAGAAIGGHLADRYEPKRMIAQALFLGGALTWLSIPIVDFLGPQLNAGTIPIVMLSAAGFLLPAATLSAIGPLVTKLVLGSIDETGAVVGRLSAASTFGALVGTFGTGFVLIALLPVRTIIVGVGAVLVLAGVVMFVRAGVGRPGGPEVVVVVLAALAGLTGGPSCDHSTQYYCVNVVADVAEDPEGRPGGRSLIIDGVRNAYVDLEDPEYLDIRYMRLLTDVVDALPSGPLRVLHVGGGGFSLPRYVSYVRPGSTNVVLELDEALFEIARDELGFSPERSSEFLFGDARLHLNNLETGAFDLIVGDAFSGTSVPWHLTTLEVVEELDRLLDSDGMYVMNVIDGGESRYARAQLATLGEVFDTLAVIEPANGIPSFGVNQILISAHEPLRNVRIDVADGRLVEDAAVEEFIGDNAVVLTDNYAPVDQLLP